MQVSKYVLLRNPSRQPYQTEDMSRLTRRSTSGMAKETGGITPWRRGDARNSPSKSHLSPLFFRQVKRQGVMEGSGGRGRER